MAVFTNPDIDTETRGQITEILGARLADLLDLQLTLKQVHWNVVGPNFIAVHEMLDPQVARVRAMSDELAERVATLGGVPTGTPAEIARGRRSDGDYPTGRFGTERHLALTDERYTTVIEGHREALSTLADLDAVSEDLLVSQTADLEQFQWFVRAHLANEPSAPEGGFGFSDRPPTPEESRLAEDTDGVPDVGSSYREMASIGANVAGEGAVPG